jgi:tRNA threonylcarbamoyladenosine biosynthesis protein TsaB
MKLLAIDTSSEACSVAVQNGSDILENHVVAPREHTRILLPMIRQMLCDADIAPAELDAVVLGNGPGSFIGMRIAASVAQGICYAAGLLIVPVSSLAAVASEALESQAAKNVIVAQDARMNEVYVGIFSAADDGPPRLRGEERICAVGRIDEIPTGTIAAGAAWHKYAELLSANRPAIIDVSNIRVPRARYLLAAGGEGLAAGATVSPEALAPAYLRVKVAEKPGAVT